MIRYDGQAAVCVFVVFLLSGCLGWFGDPGAPSCHDTDGSDSGVAPAQPGPDEVSVMVTRDFGQTFVGGETVAFQDGETVMDALMRTTKVETSYGGQFVQSIDGVGTRTDPSEWFYEVNGRFAHVGAQDWDLAGGERIHWDYRDWTGPPVAGLFNSFPWDSARVFVDGVPMDRLPDEIQDRGEDWKGIWPDGPAVLVTSPENASWESLEWIQRAGDSINACERLLEPPWALTSRVGPLGSVRALVVTDNQQPVIAEWGTAWVAREDGTIAINP